jgi:SAM-dependent methyltransferase
MAEWFEDWFDQEEYLAVYNQRNDEDAKKVVSLIINNVNLPASSSVLDIACGTGRHSILFALRGFDVTAVDLSRELLLIAEEKSNELKLKINFVREDLRKFKDKNKYNLVLNLFTSFGYFKSDAENLKMISLAYNHLKNKGYFIFDYFNKIYLEKNLIKVSKDYFNDLEIIQYRKIENERIIKEILIKSKEEIKKYIESVKLYGAEFLIKKFNEQGFNIRHIFGSYNGDEFNPEKSPRLILICQR